MSIDKRIRALKDEIANLEAERPEKKRQLRSELTPEGFELPDPEPFELPVGFTRPPTIQEMVQMYVRGAVSRSAAEQGYESFEEADDFSIDDDPETRSPYELSDEQDQASYREFVEELPKPATPPVQPPLEAEGAKPKAPKQPKKDRKTAAANDASDSVPDGEE